MTKNLSLISAIMIAVTFGYMNCSDSNFKPADVTSAVRGQNSLNVQVGVCGNVNSPCTTVTVCSPGTSSCVSIPQVLVDTGSYGLRIFSSVVSVSLNQATVSGGNLAECVGYADGTHQWGPIKMADVMLAQETAKNVPIQVIDSTFGKLPSSCINPESSPANSGFNGILGVGLFISDCGPGCASIANNQMYFSCNSTNCTSTMVPIAQQVSNPVAFLPVDNNGVVLQFPAIANGGANTVVGSLTFGIGTQSNNTPSGAKTFFADANGNFTTTYNNKPITTAFIDSGSNGLFFPDSSITQCSSKGNAAGFYCPNSVLSLSATQQSSSSSTSSTISFHVINAENILIQNNPNTVFNDLAGTLASDFDWGLPFFLGRSIYVGIEGKNSSLGQGPYWAY